LSASQSADSGKRNCPPRPTCVSSTAAWCGAAAASDCGNRRRRRPWSSATALLTTSSSRPSRWRRPPASSPPSTSLPNTPGHRRYGSNRTHPRRRSLEATPLPTLATPPPPGLAQHLYLPRQVFPALRQAAELLRDFVVLLQDQLVVVRMAIEVRVG